jgi:hypothetical protein
MSNDAAVANAPANAAPTSATAMLFQKAHAKIVTLQRVDEQLQSLLEQRKRLQDELRGVQALINDEFNRVTEQPEKTADRILNAYKDSTPGKNGRRNSPNSDPIRMEVTEGA